MVKKLGRPKLDNPKNIKLTVKITPEQDSALNEYCDKNNIKKPDAVRKAIDNLVLDNLKNK